jgi:hypothetical protein
MPHVLLISRRFLIKGISSLISTLAVLVIVGYGASDELGKHYAVYGTVTYKGEPVADASISFFPAAGQTNENRGASGTAGSIIKRDALQGETKR